MYITLILFLFVLFFTFVSITGFGKLFLNLSNLNIHLVSDFKILEFIFGLIFIGFFGIIINFITNINDFITLSTMTFGAFLYFLFFIKTKNKKNEIYSILLLVFVAFFFAFYSLSNDDFDYHFKTILLFKEYNIFEITHERRTSYNSHWLFINAVYYLKLFPASVFCITALFYSLTLFDFYVSLKRNFNNSNYLPAIYSFFGLVFFIGVINNFKEYGTDFPGQIILLYIFLIFFEKNKSIIRKNEFKVFIILIFLSFFAFTIKISNVLIFILLFFIFFQMKRNIYLFLICLPCAIPILFWFIQNYLISSCLVWPLSFTCFNNIAQASQEMYLIEMFAKGELDKSLVENFNWVPFWFVSHFPKILEKYTLYFILLLIPPIICKFLKRRNKSIPSFDIKVDLYQLKIDNPYLSFSLISIFCTVIWFVYSPAYRFGISFNLNFLIIFLIPLWHNIFLYEKLFFKKFLKILISISLVFFVYKNTYNKYQKYLDRHGTKWPNIVENEYIYKKN